MPLWSGRRVQWMTRTGAGELWAASARRGQLGRNGERYVCSRLTSDIAAHFDNGAGDLRVQWKGQ